MCSTWKTKGVGNLVLFIFPSLKSNNITYSSFSGNPIKQTKKNICWGRFTFPVTKVISLTIPDCKVHRKMYPLTFVTSAVWIGVASYISCWMISILGIVFFFPWFHFFYYFTREKSEKNASPKSRRKTFPQCNFLSLTGDTFKVPDIVMGMLFLAAGGAVPECSSAIINAKNRK